MEIILASKSPRRKQLLALCGIDFKVREADVDEILDESVSKVEAIEKLALHKAQTIWKQHPHALVIGADTIVLVDDEVLGKPIDIEDAKVMLRKLSGRTHQVITGVCLMDSQKVTTFSSVVEVDFCVLDEKEIEDYANSGEPMDKAGAYGIQGLAAPFILSIHGDYYAVMGLPVSRVYEHLKNW
ncbi:MAG: septum formation inhibitor Maf [Firmicutes bacterium HGW-Firmicutes-19]|jgi:septum formation protein|nr:MAG: septum formation inhibitor Maf [Firmicutes bacterium HGW-Firmicutes-19]